MATDENRWGIVAGGSILVTRLVSERVVVGIPKRLQASHNELNARFDLSLRGRAERGASRAVRQGVW